MDKKANFMANLMKSKQIMEQADNKKVDHVALNAMMQNTSGGDQLLESIPNGATPHTNPTRQMGNTYKNLETSKMPEAIKQAMIENPIPKLEMASGGGPTFSIDDVKSLIKPQLAERTQTQIRQVPDQISNQNITQGQINETSFVNSKGKMLITLTEEELDKKINDALLNFMATTFTKNLTETTIKRTISTLIKEGKIKVKQKTIKS